MPLTNDFSLIITAHRGGPMLQACLDSAARLDPPPRELILAIDGADPAVLAEPCERAEFGRIRGRSVEEVDGRVGALARDRKEDRRRRRHRLVVARRDARHVRAADRQGSTRSWP